MYLSVEYVTYAFSPSGQMPSTFSWGPSYPPMQTISYSSRCSLASRHTDTVTTRLIQIMFSLDNDSQLYKSRLLKQNTDRECHFG